MYISSQELEVDHEAGPQYIYIYPIIGTSSYLDCFQALRSPGCSVQLGGHPHPDGEALGRMI